MRGEWAREYLKPPEPVYAFDIDGVLCDTRAAHKAELERELGVVLEDGGDYAHFGFRHTDPAVMARLREIALDLWRRPRVVRNGEASGQDVLFTLARAGRLAGYVTRREFTIGLYETTLSWLWQHKFPFWLGCGYVGEVVGITISEEMNARNRQQRELYVQRVHSMHEDRAGFIAGLRKEGNRGVSLVTLHHMANDTDSKAAIALAMGATHLVEDSPREAWDAAKDGIQVVVIRRDYNAEFERQWQANRAELFGEDREVWCRIDFIDVLEELK